jgi:hypothetical protein
MDTGAPKMMPIKFCGLFSGLLLDKAQALLKMNQQSLFSGRQCPSAS